MPDIKNQLTNENSVKDARIPLSTSSSNVQEEKLSKKDFDSGREVRWCPGCGDYAILSSMQKVLADIGASPKDTVFISGIGCASRFPYYMNTYGFHTIHGRAPAVATGLKLANPNLDVWLVTGDGDGLSIGLSHLMHLIRRNVNVNVLLFNNRIYGLTKGQYSPTSEQGKISKTSPLGSIEQPIHPISIALAAGCGFIANAIDVDAPHLQSVLKAAAMHEGTALIEIYQNCNVFNDGAFSDFADKKVRHQKTIYLQDKMPLVFGKDNELAIIKSDNNLKVVSTHSVNPKDIVVHDVSDFDLAMQLSRIPFPDFPVPLGIFRKVVSPTYESLLENQMIVSKENNPQTNLAQLFRDHVQVWRR